MKCINKNTVFYKNLVKEGYSSRQIAQITDKLEQEKFNTWYGQGERDSFKNPALIENLYLMNDKGEKINLNDLLNNTEYQKRQFYSADLTYLDKINKFLEEERVGISKRISAFRDTDYADRLKELLESLDKLDKNDYVTALTKHSEYILKTVGDFETRFYENDKLNKSKLSKVEKEQNDVRYKKFLIHSNDFLQTFSKINNLETPQIDGIKVGEVIKKLKEVEGRVTELQNKVNSEIESETRKTLESYISNPAIRAGIQDFLAAQVDESKAQVLLDALGDSHIPFLAAVDKFFKKAMFDRDEEVKEMTKDWQKFVKNHPDFNGFLDKILEKINDKKTGRFIPKFDEGYYEKLFDFRNKLNELKASGKEETPEFTELQSEYFTWKKDNTEQKYTKEYYDALDILTPDAREAREKVDKLKSEIMSKGVDKLTPDDFVELGKLEQEIKWMKSKVNPDGSLKEGKDLEVANSLFNYSKAMSNFYYTKGIAKKAFDKAKVEAEEQGGEYGEKWNYYNTSEQYSEAFWRKFKDLLDQFPKSSQLEAINDEIKQLLVGYKDEKGEIKVNEIPDELATKLADLKKAKSILKSDLNKTININVRRRLGEEFKALVEFVPSSQYLQALSQKKQAIEDAKKEVEVGTMKPAQLIQAEKDYEEWDKKNHYVNEYTEEVQPVDMWTTMKPRNPKHIERVPNNLWKVTDIKPEFLNPNFKLDANGYPVPNDKWINSAYQSLSDTEKEGLNYIQEKLMYLVDHSKNNIIKRGYLPAVPKDKRKFWDALKGKDLAKEEQDFSEKAITEADEIVKFIPFKYVKKLNQEELPKVTADMDETQIKEVEEKRKQQAQQNKLGHGDAIDYDLANTMQTFIKAALNNKYKTDIETDIKLFKEQLKHSKVKVTDAMGGNIYDKIKGTVKGEKVEHEINAVGTNMEKHFNDWLEAVFYEDFEHEEGKLQDYAKKIESFTSLRALGFNVLSGVNNKLIGNIQERIESAGGRYYQYKDYRQARKIYFSNITNFIADHKTMESKNFLSAYIKEFDVLISQDELGGNPNGSLQTLLHKAKMIKETAYFMQHIGEHQIQNATLLAMSQSHRVVDGQIMSFNEFYEKKKIPIAYDKKLTDKELQQVFKDIDANYALKKTLHEEFEANPTVMDSFDFVDGFLKLKADSKITKDELFNFKQRIIGINQRLHGIYNTEDAAMIQRYALGRLGMQFRKWMRPGWNRRFGAKFGKSSYNERIRDTEEGMYVTSFKFLANPFTTNYKEYRKQQEHAAYSAFKSILSGFKDLVFNSKIRWHSMSEVEKANVRKTGAEMLFLVSVIALGFLAKNIKGEADDDEKAKQKLLTFTLYQADRLFGELTTYTPIGIVREGNRLFSSPSPVFNTLEDVGKLSTAMFMYPFRDDEERTFKTGIYHGEDKVFIYGGDMVPVFNQFRRLKYMNANTQRYGVFK